MRAVCIYTNVTVNVLLSLIYLTDRTVLFSAYHMVAGANVETEVVVKATIEEDSTLKIIVIKTKMSSME